MLRDFSHTQIATWKRCRLKHAYRYKDRLYPIRRPARVEVGNYVHALLAAYYRGENVNEASDRYWVEMTKPLFVEEIVANRLEDVRQLAEAVTARYIDHYRAVADQWEVLAVEEELRMRVPTTAGNLSQSRLHIKLDLVAVDKATNTLLVVDHKVTSRTFQEFANTLVLDPQANEYLWGVTNAHRRDGVIKVAACFNLIRSKLPTVPHVLKKGGLSRAKDIDTTQDVYLAAINEYGYDPDDYAEILDYLAIASKPFFHREVIDRTPEELDAIGRELYYTAMDIRRGKVFRNGTSDCSWDCDYRELCIIEAKGGDGDYYRKANFNRSTKPDSPNGVGGQ